MKPFEVIVTNVLTSQEKARAGFNTKGEAEAWLKKKEESVAIPWGMQKKRWATQKPKDNIFLEERVLEFDGKKHKQYLLPAEYTVEIKDNRDVLRKLEVKAKWNNLRKERDEMLQKTDWTQLADAPIDSNQKCEYREYRQYLRNIPTLYQNKQILKLQVMSIEDWRQNKPIYKLEKK